MPEPAQPKLLQARRRVVHFDHVTFAYGEKDRAEGLWPAHPARAACGARRRQRQRPDHRGQFRRCASTTPRRSTIRIGDTDLRELATRDLRRQIAVVTQENILFNDTIRRNIELGRPGASQEEIIAAARHAMRDEFHHGKAGGL